MLNIGMFFIVFSLIMWLIATFSSLFGDFAFIFVSMAIFFNVMGGILISVQVLKDRLKEKKEEENDDYSKYW